MPSAEDNADDCKVSTITAPGRALPQVEMVLIRVAQAAVMA
jgi:hypothetical protein